MVSWSIWYRKLDRHGPREQRKARPAGVHAAPSETHSDNDGTDHARQILLLLLHVRHAPCFLAGLLKCRSDKTISPNSTGRACPHWRSTSLAFTHLVHQSLRVFQELLEVIDAEVTARPAVGLLRSLSRYMLLDHVVWLREVEDSP